MAKNPKRSRRKQAKSSAGPRRKEYRFATKTTYMARWVAVVGMLGSLVLGAGVFGLWVLDPALEWASYLVAAGGLGLGVALWFGPAETAVFVGDAGVAVEDGREVIRVPWYKITNLAVSGDSVVVRSPDVTARFSLGANEAAAAWVFKEAAERVPDVLNVDQSVSTRLPEPSSEEGSRQNVRDDQVAGSACANSQEVITLEEEARLCPRCGQVYHQSHVPERCVSCDEELKGRVLRP